MAKKNIETEWKVKIRGQYTPEGETSYQKNLDTRRGKEEKGVQGGRRGVYKEK